MCVRRDGISRPTVYKWIERHKKGEGLDDRSRAPHSPHRRISSEIEELIVHLRGFSRKGAKKIAAELGRIVDRSSVPAVSSINEVLGRHQLLVPHRKKRRIPGGSKPQGRGKRPNDVWCADYKGHFQARNGERCDPLTISDEYSRFLLRCPLVKRLDFDCAWPVFRSAFLEYGLPSKIRTDNGVPFATRGLAGLSRLSILFLKLGIRHERIERGHPEQNGRHERIHLTMDLEALTPRAASRRSQHKHLMAWRRIYNEQRCHEALGMRTPAEVYVPSTRSMPKHLGEFEYSTSKYVRKIDASGQLKWKGSHVFVSEVLGGENVGLFPINEELFAVYLGPLKLGLLNVRKVQFTAEPDWKWAVEMAP